MAGREVDWNEVQGIVLSSYKAKPETHYYLLQIVDAKAARAWLKKKHETFSYGNDHTRTGLSVNIAFTLKGLAALGLPDDALDTFPWDFRDGMTSPLRTRILRDEGLNARKNWFWGADDEVHLLILAYGKQDTSSEDLKELVSGWAGAFTPVAQQAQLTGYRPEDKREHFGFIDGLSQPAIDTSPRADRLRESKEYDGIVQPGEFILGYVNERGQLPVSPSVAMVDGADLPVITNADRSVSGHPPAATFPRLDFGRNGTFLVYRQLEQDVFAFAKLIEEMAKALHDGDAPRLSDEAGFKRQLAAKIIGRWDDGTSMTLAPNSPPPPESSLRYVNNFGYATEDSYGLRCPIGAHVRRAFPRDTLDDDAKTGMTRNKRHRLLRRGRLYGERTFNDDHTPEEKKKPGDWKAWDNNKKPNDGVQRGLHFVALNASIESQFEFVQQTWMNTSFFGDLTDELDPLIGTPSPGQPHRFTLQGAPINRRVSWTDPLVRMRGGAYFFLPSRAALAFMSDEGLMSALAR